MKWRWLTGLMLVWLVVTPATAKAQLDRIIRKIVEDVEEALVVPKQAAPKGIDAADADGEVPAELKSYMKLLTVMLNTELQFLTKVAQVDEPQLEKIRQSGQIKLIEIARYVHKSRNQHSRDDTDPLQKQLTDQLVKVADEVLPAEQANKYRSELEARWARSDEGVAELMTLNTDRLLSLRDDQYDAVKQEIMTKLEPSWSKGLMSHMYPEYCPLPKVEVIGPALDAEQKKLWGKQGRTSRISFGWESDVSLRQMGINTELKFDR